MGRITENEKRGCKNILVFLQFYALLHFLAELPDESGAKRIKVINCLSGRR